MKKIWLGIVVILAIVLVVFIYKGTNSAEEVLLNNISGKYSSVVITDFESAKDSLEDVADALNIDSLDSLKEDSNYSTNIINTFKFIQTYDDLEVYGAFLVVYADLEGNALGVINNYKDISDLDTEATTTSEDFEDIVMQELSSCDDAYIADTSLIIYETLDSKFILAYKYEVNIGITIATVIIDANSGEVLDTIIPIYELTETDINNYKVNSEMKSLAKEVELSLTKDYAIIDTTNDIVMSYSTTKEIHPKTNYLYEFDSVSEAEDINVELAITTLNNVNKVKDYYLDKFNYDSFDGRGISIQVINEVQYLNGKNYTNNAFQSLPNVIGLGSNDLFNDDIEVIAHEYTHGIFQYTVGNHQSKEAFAINEAYSDIMGMIIEAYYNDSNKLDGVIKGVKRNIKYSTNKYKENKSNKGLTSDEHENSTIISRAAYKMSKKMDLDDFANLWFNSMFLMGEEPTFYDCKYAVLETAKILGFSDDLIEEIESEFESVGIKGEVSNVDIFNLKNDLVTKNSDLINSELENAQYFANKKFDGIISVIAVNNSGEEIKLIETDEAFDAIDYSYGKLYLQRGRDFFEIDLNQGNGNYSINKIYSVTSDDEWYNIQMTVYNGCIYYNQANKDLAMYDLDTKESKFLASSSNDMYFVIDKENGIIYYTFKSKWKDILYSYNIATDEKENLLEGDNIMIGGISSEGLVYAKDGVIYEYNSSTGIHTEIVDDYLAGLIYIDGKLYYERISEQYTYSEAYGIEVQNVELVLYDNSGYTTYMTLDDDTNVANVYPLANNEVEIITYSGQDYPLSINTYIFNADTLKITSTNTTYLKDSSINGTSDNVSKIALGVSQVSYVTAGSDTYTKDEESNTASEISYDVVGSWEAVSTNSTKYTLGYLFGTYLSYQNYAEFKEDGTYEIYIGSNVWQEGNYVVEDGKIVFSNTTYGYGGQQPAYKLSYATFKQIDDKIYIAIEIQESDDVIVEVYFERNED